MARKLQQEEGRCLATLVDMPHMFSMLLNFMRPQIGYAVGTQFKSLAVNYYMHSLGRMDAYGYGYCIS